MPGGDRTGPTGKGPGTGRGAGFCSGNDVPGYANAELRGRGGGMARRRQVGKGPGGGRGLGRRTSGRGFGIRGGRRAYGGGEYAPETIRAESGIDILRQERDRLESELAEVKERLKAAGEQTGE